MKKKLATLYHNAIVKQAVSAAENWAVRALLAYLLARQVAPHKVP